ncbi:MAG: GntR family transcriptional regulator [Spirochaetota bacterium]
MMKIEYADLSEKVYREIRTMILQGSLLPGEKLKQDQLANHLGISRTPLAAAFSKLEKEMLVELLPRRGARIRALSSQELLDLYDIRIKLEPLGAEGAAKHCSADEIDELQSLLRAYKDIVDSDSAREVRRADYDFHLAIARMSGNEALHRIISAFNIVFICNQGGLLKPAVQSYQEHIPIVQAIAARDPAAAEQAMRHHLVDSRDRLVMSVREES